LDNVQLNIPQSSGAIIATDEISSVQHQLVKLEYGVDGAATMVSTSNPLPVTDADAEASLVSILAKLSADPSTETTLAALLAKIIAAPSTEAKQDTIITAIGTTNAKDFATQTTLALIKAKTDNLDVALSTRAVTGLTDAELRATPVPISGTVTATPSGTQNVDVTANTIGLSTGTKQDAQTALLTTIDGDTSNISTKIDTIAGAVAGTEMQVDVLTMPSVTVTATNLDIRDLVFASDKVDASGTVLGAGTNNIGDVDIITMPNVVIGSGTVTAVTSITNTVNTKEVRSATPSQSSPSVTNASTSILASNSNRLGATIFNEGAAISYTKLGGTASITSYTVQIASGGYYECPFGYTGAIDGITSSGTAQLRVTELTT